MKLTNLETVEIDTFVYVLFFPFVMFYEEIP